MNISLLFCKNTHSQTHTLIPSYSYAHKRSLKFRNMYDFANIVHYGIGKIDYAHTIQ